MVCSSIIQSFITIISAWHIHYDDLMHGLHACSNKYGMVLSSIIQDKKKFIGS